MLAQLAAKHRERLHQARDVLLRIGSAHVEQEWIMDAVAIQHALYFGRPCRILPVAAELAESRIGGVMHNLNSAGGNLKHRLHVAARCAGYRKHAVRTRQAPAEIKQSKIAAIAFPV